MGKHHQESDHYQHRNLGDVEDPESSRFFCHRFSKSLSRVISLRCVVVLILSFAVLLFGFFSLISLRPKYESDAKQQVKSAAPVQAYFRLEKPVSIVVSRKARLKKDIFKKVNLSDTEVTILSMDPCGESNCTDVRFAVFPVATTSAISQESLSSLRHSFVELFAKQSNLSLVASNLGQPSTFQVLKFHGGITVITLESDPISGVLEILFNFTLNNSISQIQDSLVHLTDRLKFGLHLRPYERIHVEIMNEEGSTISPPVTVQASVRSTMPMGDLLPQRLEQLSQNIQVSGAKNLGLDYSIFGEVKSITLSNLKSKLLTAASTMAPAPSPQASLPSFPSPEDSSSGYSHEAYGPSNFTFHTSGT